MFEIISFLLVSEMFAEYILWSVSTLFLVSTSKEPQIAKGAYSKYDFSNCLYSMSFFCVAFTTS